MTNPTAWCAHQVKARDLQVFVEVLLNCSEDPREILDIRASEARLKAQVDNLQSRLSGPQHRAALDASKHSEVPFFVAAVC